MATKLKPLFNNVLLKRNTEEQRTPSGLLIKPAGSDKGQEAWLATVLEVGPGEPLKTAVLTTNEELVGGTRCVSDIQPGDEVYVPAYNGYKVFLGMEEFLLVKDTEILCVVSND